MTRSGTRAILEWIAMHFDGKTLLKQRTVGSETISVAAWQDKKPVDSLSDPDTLLISWENPRDGGDPPVGIRYTPLRSFYNLAASRLRMYQRHHVRDIRGNLEETARQWVDAARKHDLVRYDIFVTDAEYRRAVESFLELPTVPEADLHLEKNIAKPGSSFSNHDFMNRWRITLDDPEFRPVLRMREVKAWNHIRFGWYLDEEGQLCR